MNNLEPLISPSVLVACQQFGVPVVMRCPHYHLICPIGLHLRNGAVCELCCGGREYWCVLKNCRGNIFESVGYALRSTVARKRRLFLDNVTYYLPPTRFVKRRLSDAGFPQKRIIVLPNMVCVPDSGVDVFYGKYVAYVGRFSPEKGIQTLLTSARQIGLPVRLAGDYLSLPEVLKAAPPNVQFTGHLNQNRLVEFYRNARFVVIPSICFDVSPLTAAEAMSHGLPVIAAKIGGIPELVEDGVTGFLFEPTDSEDLTSKMKLLWENPDLCRQMGKAGREKAIREYSEDKYYRRLMAVYERAVQAGVKGSKAENSRGIR